jgi:hypothetical protein
MSLDGSLIHKDGRFLMTRLNKLAALCIAILFVYYEIYRWIPLGRWNWQFHLPVTNDQFYPDIGIGILLLWFAWSFATCRKSGMWTASILLSLWAVVHCIDWWIPYARSLQQNAGRYQFYESHTQLLPVIGNHFPPDAGHVVLDLILFPTCLVAVLATALHSRRSCQSSKLPEPQ